MASMFQLLMAISIIEKNRGLDPNVGKKAAVEGMGVESNTGQKEFEENKMEPFLRRECVGMGLFFVFQVYLVFLNDKMGKALELKVEEMVGKSESYMEIVRSQLVQVGVPWEGGGGGGGGESVSWGEREVGGGRGDGGSGVSEKSKRGEKGVVSKKSRKISKRKGAELPKGLERSEGFALRDHHNSDQSQRSEDTPTSGKNPPSVPQKKFKRNYNFNFA